MFKGGIPPFKKNDINLIKITKERSFQPNLLITSLLKKKEKKTN